jgi:flagellar hook-length control protein FliK
VAIGADESLRSSGAQRALQTLLAQANPGGVAIGANAQPVDTQQPGNESVQSGDAVDGVDGADSATTNAPALTSASTLTGASTLDAANALNPAGAAMADAMQTAAATTHLAPSGASSNTLALQSELHAAVGTTEWTAELGGQLTWMAQHGIGSASLQVSPPNLGPIEVRIAVHGGAASVWFGAAQADTRAALEQALPRLHELFGAQGLALADASVSRESPQQQREPTGAMWGGAGAAQTPGESATQSAAALQRVGLLDLYA